VNRSVPAETMMPTKAMIIAARRAEFDYYQKSRKLGAGRFIGTPDEVIKVTLEAALQAGSSGPHAAALDQMTPPAPAPSACIVTTTNPKR
jgi:hypothetical protein